MKSAPIEVGLRSTPYLVDHAVQDVALVPGAFYVATALRLQRDAGQVRNVMFHSPVLLTEEGSQLEVEAKLRDDGATEYLFCEAGGGKVATLEIEPPAPAAERAAFSPDEFKARAQTEIEARGYYTALRANGNQYGARFQGITRLWRADRESLGLIEVPPADQDGRQTLLFDCLVQMLASFALEQGRTFILRSIAKIERLSPSPSGALWVHARLGTVEGNDHVGEVHAFDESGRLVLRLSGVAFTLAAQGAAAAAELAIAANFTAEPLEDSLRFWGAHFGLRLRTDFAPYNQVFQQLLDPNSLLGTNRCGVNVVLLALEEWAARPGRLATLTRVQADECFGARERTVLPNGLEIAHLNGQETGYLYEEIFADECYLRHGVVLEDGDTVVDVGANIGMFSLFVQSRCPGARIYAFEPAPAAFDVLSANCAAYAPGARVFNAGVSGSSGTARLTVYGKASVFSGFHAEEQDDRAALQAVIRNMLKRESGAGEALEDYAEELAADRLGRSEHECRMTSISDFMRDNGIERIGLLKIDAEKSEAAILAGIREEDWQKIEQLVVEVHDRAGGAAQRILRELRERGYRCTLDQPALLRYAGLCNLYATRRAASKASPRDERKANLERNVREFCAALRAHMQRAAAPLVLCICPRKSADAAVEDAERALLEQTAAVANVHAIPSASLRRYGAEEFHDAEADRAGHVPYTAEGYAALGTAVMRTIYGLKRRPHKVIALDCDNTLWKGVCGEDGAAGVELTPARRALQEFMVARMQAGMLLCLCTKNNEQDVMEVFERRDDMPLRLSHLAARRINWQAKPQNLQALAAELGLGLDSFIFVDDDPVECAQVRQYCPAVLTLQLPREEDALGAFLEHAWALDQSASTEEDRGRTRMVQESARRRQFRERAPSLKDFIAGLELRIEIAAAADTELGRVAQLIARTNQFSMVTRRRTESELRQFLARPGARCIAVRVADRFGDYGLVGAVLYELAPGTLRVDSWLLSCRALGRGVEHAMAAWLGREALAQGRPGVELAHRPTGRNRPALEFFIGLGGPKPGDPDTDWGVPAGQLARVAYAAADAEPTTEATESPSTSWSKARDAWDFGAADSQRFQQIAEELRSAGQIALAIEAQQRRAPALAAGSPLAQAGSFEAALADIWARVLGRAQVGLHDNFFDAGGTSLKAVRVVALVKKELGRTLQVVGLLECPTVASLAARLETNPGTSPAAADTSATEAGRRGQRRRQHQTGLRTA